MILATAHAGKVARSEFGRLPDGRAVHAITLKSDGGATARILTLGATVQSLTAADRTGAFADVVLGYDGVDGYLASTSYLGVTVGRYANRVAGGKFVLDGVSYQSPKNDGANSLHGGPSGFDKALWTIVDTATSDKTASVALKLLSPDGDQGFPGALSVTARFVLDEHGTLAIDYAATTSKPTIANLTNHSYFNLAGRGSSVLDHRLTVRADAYTPIDAEMIPTGEVRDVGGTPFDFRRAVRIGDRLRDGRDEQLRLGRGFDHNFALSGPAHIGLREAVRLYDPASGRRLILSTDQAGLQVYTGNFLNATEIGKAQQLYRQGDAIALEPQAFPDTPNQPSFGSVRLDPGQTYRCRSTYQFQSDALTP